MPDNLPDAINNIFAQHTPTADPLGPDKVGPDGMATPVEARGESPGPGYEWMRAQAPSGRWAETWVYVGVQHGTGGKPVPGESPMQYAQRMGVPMSLLGVMTSFEAVNAYLHPKLDPEAQANADAAWVEAFARMERQKP